MKIMAVITGMQSGGAERVMATLCNELSKRHEVCLVIMKSAQADYFLSDRIEILAGNIQNQNLIQCVQFTRKAMETKNPDVILSFMTKTNIIVLLSAIQAKMCDRVVIAERGNPYRTKTIFRIMRNILYRYTAGAVFQTEQARKYYTGIIKRETTILKNPLNPDFNVKPYNGIRRKVIVTMGRLSEEKNQKLLIDAFSQIAQRIPEYTVEIYGDGPLKEELNKQIVNSGLSYRIVLMGRKEHVEHYVEDAGIFVLPSNSEGMPNALLEAMAMGIPSIATDCPVGGSAIIIKDHNNGLLIPMNDAKALSSSIIELIENDELSSRISKNACDVLKDYSAEKVCLEWEAYLSKIAKR